MSLKAAYLFFLFLIAFEIASVNVSVAQCCAAASSVFSGASYGVLRKTQLQASAYYQYYESDKTMNADTLKLISQFEKVYGNYLNYSISYGLSDKFTIAVESGYYINKTEMLTGSNVRTATGMEKIENIFHRNKKPLSKGESISASGRSDLIIFPRYNIFNRVSDRCQTEVTIGLGSKIPIGKYNETYIAYINPQTNDTIRYKKSPGIQPSTGSNDFLFYAFLFREYKKHQLRYSANFTYMLRGTNSDGVVFGDIVNFSIHVGKPIKHKFYLGVDFKTETMDTLFDPKYLTYKYNSGGKKVSIMTQLSYTAKQKITFTLFSDIPVYQYVNGTQVASDYLFNFGIVYRLFPVKVEKEVNSN